MRAPARRARRLTRGPVRFARGDRLGGGSGAPAGHGVRGDDAAGSVAIWYFSISNVGNAPIARRSSSKRRSPKGCSRPPPKKGCCPGLVVRNRRPDNDLHDPGAGSALQNPAWRLHPMSQRRSTEADTPGERVSQSQSKAAAPTNQSTKTRCTGSPGTKKFGFREFEAAILNEDGSEALQAGSAPGEVSTAFRSTPRHQSGSASAVFTSRRQSSSSATQPHRFPQESSETRTSRRSAKRTNSPRHLGNCPPDSQVGCILRRARRPGTRAAVQHGARAPATPLSSASASSTWRACSPSPSGLTTGWTSTTKTR